MTETNHICSQHSEEEDANEIQSIAETQELQQKKFPVTSRDKQAKKVFDSADYFMEREKEQKVNSEVAEISIPDYPRAKTPLLKFRRNQKKTFDSADYFMEQEKSHKREEKAPAEANQPLEAASQKNEKIPAAEETVTQALQQEEIDCNRIPDFPEGKRPVLKSGRTEKKVFDSADYFMNQQKQKKPHREPAAKPAGL